MRAFEINNSVRLSLTVKESYSGHERGFRIEHIRSRLQESAGEVTQAHGISKLMVRSHRQYANS